MIDRRYFLKGAFVGLGAGAGFASNLASFNAFASDASDYKALVCVFLTGGMDNFDTLVPVDRESSLEYERVREPLLERYDFGQSRRRSAILNLSGSLDGREFGFPRELAPLHELYESGDLAVVGNVGPLVEPLDRASFQSKSGHRPPNLFSHNDQQSIWMASEPEGARVGWGGRFAEIMHASKANTNAAFSAVSASGVTTFLTGNSLRHFVVGRTRAADVQGLKRGPALGLGSDVFHELYEDTLRDMGNARSSFFKRDIARVMNSSLDNNSVFNEQLALPGGPTTQFPDSNLGNQLNMVARTISKRETMGMKRQVFFVSATGFDTHSRQAEDLPVLQADIADSIAAFHRSMIELGLENAVTTFTASDFGRTLGVNGDGTDHGWGGHQLVIGGAVQGGQIYGDIPPAVFNHKHDAGRGRLIPTLSVEQYASALGRWYGLADHDLIDALPGLANFDQTELHQLLV